ncbi:hypothetical protein QE152_g15351 [Popillia japonica]|uniref:Uncharacterized protein n=1 Tax=Popillia japonica TaxID=7064 RepID=A0AAW1L8M4_POPJA
MPDTRSKTKASTEEDTVCRRRSNASTPAAQLPSADLATKMPFFLKTPTISRSETDTPPAPQILEGDELIARLMKIYRQVVAAGTAKINTSSPGAKVNTSAPGAKANTPPPDARINTASPPLTMDKQWRRQPFFFGWANGWREQFLIGQSPNRAHPWRRHCGQASRDPLDADPGGPTTQTRATTTVWRHSQRAPPVYLARLEAHTKGRTILIPRGRGRPSTPIRHRRSYQVVPTKRRQLHEPSSPEDVDDLVRPYVTGEATRWYQQNEDSFMNMA